MKGMLRIAMLVAAATLLPSALVHAEEGPSRAEYVEQVEPICQANTEANKRILAHVQERAMSKQQRVVSRAAHQFIRASEAFGKAVDKIAAVPRPPVDEPRLLKWLKHLRIVKTDLRKIGGALREGDKIRAAHERIRVERAANASNNAGFVFNFHYCYLSQSRFT
jgi:heme oxygenase